MAYVEDKYIEQAIADFDEIERAIIENGVDVPHGTDTKEYGALVNQACKIQYNQGFYDNSPDAAISEFEAIIDESGVLDSTDGTIEEKVEQLIDTRYLFNKAGGINFYRSNIEYITMDCSHFVCLYFCFNVCRSLKEVHISNTDKVEDWRHSFYNVPLLHTVETIDFSGLSKSGNWSTSELPALTTFRVAPNSIKVSISFNAPNLDEDSIESIIDGLADVNAGDAQKLTLHSDVFDKVYDHHYALMAYKNWYLG